MFTAVKVSLNFLKFHKFVILYTTDKQTWKPKYYMLKTFVIWFSFLGIEFNNCFLLKLQKCSITEVTFVEDNMTSSSEEVLFESVITLSKAGKLNILSVTASALWETNSE